MNRIKRLVMDDSAPLGDLALRPVSREAGSEGVLHRPGLLTLDEYQREARRTAIYAGEGTRDGLTYTVLGLCGEAGELKKAHRDDGAEVTPERRAVLLAELGDVLWYVSQAAKELGTSLSEVAQANLDKLRSRHGRGQITGSGEQR